MQCYFFLIIQSTLYFFSHFIASAQKEFPKFNFTLSFLIHFLFIFDKNIYFFKNQKVLNSWFFGLNLY